MKILIKINFFEKTDDNVNYSPRAVDAVAYNLSEELVKRGHDVTVLATSDSQVSAKISSGGLDSRSDEAKRCVNYFTSGLDNPGEEKFFYDTVKTVFLKYLERFNEFDIIHTHDWTVGKFKFSPYYNNLIRPVLTTIHGSNVDFGQIGSNRRFVAISESQKKHYNYLPVIGVAYDGIRTKDFEFSDKVGKHLAFLGRITPEKGVLEAIEVAKKVKKKLIIAGNFDERFPEYIEKVKFEIENNPLVEYIGQVGREGRNDLLKNAFAFLMPIQWEEPFGLVAVESMACGTPVIALNRGALPELVRSGETGFIVTNLDEMCEKTLHADKIKRDVCRKHIEDNFSVSRMTDNYEEIYEKILSKKS